MITDQEIEATTKLAESTAALARTTREVLRAIEAAEEQIARHGDILGAMQAAISKLGELVTGQQQQLNAACELIQRHEQVLQRLTGRADASAGIN